MGDGSLLYHDGGIDGLFYPIHHKGFVHDVYWNHQYIIIKSSEQEENWYILKNIDGHVYSKYKVRHFIKERDYQRALDSLKLSEVKMEHTDGSIPWRLHLWR